MAIETAAAGAVYISTDSGTNWSRAALPVAWWQGVACSANGAALYATASRTTNGSPEGIYASADGGATWSQAGATPPTTNGDWGPVACSADGTRVMAGEGAHVWIFDQLRHEFAACLHARPAVPRRGRPVRLRQPRLLGGRQEGGGRRGVSPDMTTTQVAVATSADSGATWAWTSDTIPTNALVGVVGWLLLAGGLRLGRRPQAGCGGGRGARARASGLPLGPVLMSEDSGASWVRASGRGGRRPGAFLRARRTPWRHGPAWPCLPTARGSRACS